MGIVIEISSYLIEALDSLNKIKDEINHEIVTFSNKNPEFATIPSVKYITQNIEATIHKLDRVAQKIINLTKCIDNIPSSKSKPFTSLMSECEIKYGHESILRFHLEKVGIACDRIRNLRNCIEHPKPGFNVRVENYSISNGNLIPPNIIIEMNGKIDVEKFDWLNKTILNEFVAHLCMSIIELFRLKKVNDFFGHQVQIIPTTNKDNDADIIFKFHTFITGNWVPIG